MNHLPKHTICPSVAYNNEEVTVITDSEGDDVCDVEGDVSESEGEDCSISEEKVNEGGSISDVGKQSLILPPDVWAKVLEYLPYKSVVSFASASKSMLSDVLPLVTKVDIESSTQLQPGTITKHLRDVRSISIYNIFRQQRQYIELNEETISRSVGFISRFRHLDSVYFWGKVGDNVCSLNSLGNFSFMPHQRESMNHLIDEFSDAFDCGDLPNGLGIIGLSCPMRTTNNSRGCSVCKRVCENFPLNHIFDINLCIPHTTSNKIIKTRQGGKEYLLSEARFLQLMSKSHIKAERKDSMYIIGYNAEVRDAMESFVEESELDVAKFREEGVLNVILKQYTNDKVVCLNEESSDYLKNTLGLSVSDSLLDPETCKLENLPRIVNNVTKHVKEEDSSLRKSLIWIDKLLGNAQLPNQEVVPKVQIVIDSGVLPKLGDFLRRDHDYILQLQAADILTNIAAGDTGQVKAVVELGVIPQLVRLMGSSDSKISKAAAWNVGNIAGDGPGYRDLVLKAETVKPLLKLLDETSDLDSIRTFTWTLMNLCRGKPKPDFTLLRPSLQRLSELIHLSDREVLTDACWALSYLMTDRSDEHVQIGFEVMGDQGVCRLLELAKVDIETIQLPALYVLGYIAASVNHSQTQLILDKGLLPCLLTLLSSTNVSVLEHVCWAISVITEKTTDQMQAVIDSGIIPQFISLLNHERLYIRKEAAWGISNILSKGSEEQVKFLLQAGCIPPLLDSLTMVENEAPSKKPGLNKAAIAINILTGIERILELGIESHIVEYLSKIEDLQRFDNGKSRFSLQHNFLLANEVQEMATKLVEKCWAESMIDEI